MLRVVLPSVIPSGRAVHIVRALSIVVVLYIVIVDVDVDIVVPPSGSIAPTSTPCRSHRHSNSKGNSHACRIVPGRRIGDWRIGIDRRSINNGRVIAGNINHLRVRLFDDNHRFVFDLLGLNFLLITVLQVSGILCFYPHALDCIHNVALLGKESVAEVRGPLDVLGQLLHDIGQRRHCLNAGIPILFLNCFTKSFVL